MTVEEAKKNLNNTKVYVYNKSEKIQKKLFRIGYRWSDEDLLQIKHKQAPFLYIYDNGFIGWGNDMEGFLKDNRNEISIDYILNIKIDKKYNFKPYDKILISIDHHLWRGALYEKEDYLNYYFILSKGIEKNRCKILPYNEKTAFLLGTNLDYKKLLDKNILENE